MVKLLTILMAVLVISCSPEKRIQKIVKKHPHLLQTDTITIHDTVIVQSYTYDTTTILVPHKTVEVINNEKVRLVYKYDTITSQIWHEVECKGDTIVKIHEVPVETIKIQEKDRTEWKFWALLGCVVLGLIAFLVKGR
jgi:hypothetical protein